MYSDFNFIKVYLMLGQACDFNCRYCCQHEHQVKLTKHPSDKLIKYLQHLADIRPRNITGIPKDLELVFFGGEPLLYLKTIKLVIEQVNRTNVKYVIVSNGNKLTQDIVDYINENNIHFTLSNDGRYTEKTRDRNVLEDDNFVDLFKQINNRSINMVLTQYSQDLFDNWNYFDSKLGLTHVSLGDFLVDDNTPTDIYDFDYDKWEATCERLKSRLFEIYTTDNSIDLSKYHEVQLVGPDIKQYFNFIDGKAEFPKCGHYRNVISIDLDGNFFLCHNGMSKFCDCEQDGVKVAKLAAVHFANLRNDHNKPCDNCIAIPFCQEGCPFVKYSERQEKICKIHRIYASKILELIKMIDEYNSTDIEL